MDAAKRKASHVVDAPTPKLMKIIDESNKENALPDMRTEDELTVSSEEELVPLEDPDTALQESLGKLKTNIWSEQFKGVSTLRAIIVHHYSKNPSLQDAFEQAVPLVSSLANSLRSSLARNSLRLLAEIFERFGNSIDLSKPVSQVLLKACQEKKFIREEAEKALESLVRGRGHVAALSWLLDSSSHKNPGIVAKSASTLASIVQKMSVDIKSSPEMPRLLRAASSFAAAKLPEGRAAGRRILFQLSSMYSTEEFDQLVSAHLTPVAQRHVKQVLSS
mmetsp:Transcript_15584/g.26825  ORF Transcript_15584/g.26825 Transcript_15584/m.26825 type:complete len:277 (+) Transcript_15584:59-889(+)